MTLKNNTDTKIKSWEGFCDSIDITTQIKDGWNKIQSINSLPPKKTQLNNTFYKTAKERPNILAETQLECRFGSYIHQHENKSLSNVFKHKNNHPKTR